MIEYGYCGLLCSNCPLYKLSNGENEETFEKVREAWSKVLGEEIPKAEFRCEGCRSENCFSYAGECDIKECASEKNAPSCKTCKTDNCAKIKGFLEWFEIHKERLFWENENTKTDS